MRSPPKYGMTDYSHSDSLVPLCKSVNFAAGSKSVNFGAGSKSVHFVAGRLSTLEREDCQFWSGNTVNFGAGRLSTLEREEAWKSRDLSIRKTIKMSEMPENVEYT